jgi:hypothetical protein
MSRAFTSTYAAVDTKATRQLVRLDRNPTKKVGGQRALAFPWRCILGGLLNKVCPCVPACLHALGARRATCDCTPRWAT